MKRLTTRDFIDQVSIKHNNFYDYSKVIYKNMKVPITIICPKHGEFQQRPEKHKMGRGCLLCSEDKGNGGKILSHKDAIKRFIAVHGDTYDYSITKYSRMKNDITYICPTHGEITQTAKEHAAGSGCRECGYLQASDNKTSQGRLTFVDRARQVHGDRYDYTSSIYTKRHSPITILCSKHGHFTQEAGSHLLGTGCPDCARFSITKQSNVYVIKCNEFYKIGMSDNPKRRLMELNTATPYTITLVKVIPSDRASELEYELHKEFEGCRIKGEWFRLSKFDLVYIKSM
jgi:hypothetical protein